MAWFLIFTALAHNKTLIEKLQSIDDQIAQNEARLTALKKVRRYSVRMRSARLTEKEIEEVAEIQSAASGADMSVK